MTLSAPRRAILSLVAILLLTIHWRWPGLSFDNATLLLVVLGFFPWLIDHIKNVKVPGLEIEMRTLQQSAKKILVKKIEKNIQGKLSLAGELVVEHKPGRRLRPTEFFFQALPKEEEDPNLRLIGWGIEVEKRLQDLAEHHQIRAKTPSSVLPLLIEKEVLSETEASGFEEILRTRNKAAHGAGVESAITTWLETEGAEILGFLDEKLK